MLTIIQISDIVAELNGTLQSGILRNGELTKLYECVVSGSPITPLDLVLALSLKLKQKEIILSGLIQVSDTKSGTVLCKADLDGSIAKWICEGLHTDNYWVGDNATLGIYLGSKLIAGVIFNNIRKGIDVWLTIYSENKRWCNRRILRLI